MHCWRGCRKRGRSNGTSAVTVSSTVDGTRAISTFVFFLFFLVGPASTDGLIGELDFNAGQLSGYSGLSLYGVQFCHRAGPFCCFVCALPLRFW